MPNFLVHLVYCESGIETFAGNLLLNRKQVHLVYCESGIETRPSGVERPADVLVHLVYCESGIETRTHSRGKAHWVHLVYCESGIETSYFLNEASPFPGSFSLLRERY